MQKISIAYTYTKERSFMHVMNFMKCKDDHISKQRRDNNIVTSFFFIRCIYKECTLSRKREVKAMSYEQVGKDLEKVIGYIHSDNLSDEEKKTMTEQTLDYFDNYVSPGWLKYRKSVSTNSAVLEWTDHDSVVEGLYGEEFID